MNDLRRLVRTIPDYPKPGIMFRDVTTLLGDAQGFKAAIEGMAAPYQGGGVDAVAGIEARGFILGGAIADARLRLRADPQEGQAAVEDHRPAVQLEYGVDIIEIHEDAIKPGERILIVDDLIATGGTAEAAAKLVSARAGSFGRDVHHRPAGARRPQAAAQARHPHARAHGLRGALSPRPQREGTWWRELEGHDDASHFRPTRCTRRLLASPPGARRPTSPSPAPYAAPGLAIIDQSARPYAEWYALTCAACGLNATINIPLGPPVPGSDA